MRLIDADKYRNSLLESLDNAKRWKAKAINAGAGDEIVIRAHASINMLVECLLRLKEQNDINNAVQVVRCKDCKYFEDCETYCICTNPEKGWHTKEDNYCESGERKGKIATNQ